MVSGFTPKQCHGKSRSLIMGLSFAVVLGTSQAVNAQHAATPRQLPALLTTLPPLPVIDSIPIQGEEMTAVRVVVRLSQRRVYVYRGDQVLAKYPIAIGKRGWETPTGRFQVLSKEKNPVFKNFRTGQLIYPGPDNPLGSRWIGIWTDGKTQIGFHGTNQEELLGQAVSHGCIRMRNRDVTTMFEQVPIGTAVMVEP
jgi:lipoprotein-anchoring transpeptidase ErfK/SrfK